MYLKQIEVHGFKSFANDTVLNFERGITGIVGPNGSGKSNIADAVRWVLGEQKVKQLRSSNMQDVIFSGTENRKAQGFAYVSLVIDNTDRKLALDFDEVQVSRRLYRSGESEYKLNNTECRLRDINELFYDTGIGKEGYSIIGQGQIDKILSNKPEDRRELFDEAVGIVKYKRRKTIAEKKLEEERLNLSRVSDIIGELDRQVGPLRKQAEAAKEYLALRDDLILYESNYFVREINEDTKKIEDAKKNIEINANDLKLAKQKKQAFNEKYLAIENEITEIDLKVSELKDKVSEKNSLKENLLGKINVIKEQINSYEQTTKSRTDRIEALKKNMFQVVENIENSMAIVLSLKKQIEFISNNNNDIDESNVNLNNDIIKIDDCIEKTKSAVYKVFGEDFNLDLSREFSKNIFSDDSTFNNLDEKRKDVEKIETDIKNATDELNTLNEKLYKFNEMLENINEDILINQNHFHSEETKLETLKNMLERYEGYNNAIKFVLDNRHNFDGIKGVVADILETDKKYEVAIEIALGGSIQNLVTDNVETAKKVIEFLKTNKAGRVTILPLSSLNEFDYSVYQRAMKENGAIDLAVNLVKRDKIFDNLANFLLRRCLIVDNFEHAKEIHSKYKKEIKIVTLDGELFNPGGSISGGTYKNSTSLIGRKREYEDLKLSLDKLKDKVDSLNNDKMRVGEDYDECYDAIEKLKEKIGHLEIEKNTKTLNIISDIKLEYTTISNKANFTIDDLNRLINDLENLFIEKSGIEASDNSSSSLIVEKENDIKNYELEIDTIKKELLDIENEITTILNKKEENLSNRKEYNDEKDRLTTEVFSLEQEAYRLNDTIEKSTKNIEDVSSAMYENYNMTYNVAKEKYNEDLGSLDEIKKLLKEKRKVIQSLGPINVNAIEEYKQVSERYGTMSVQYEDIKKSEEMIAGIVKELDESMRKQFDENFKVIKLEFDKVFKELFGGGKANLELVEVEDKDVLDAGVAIVVQPPGKKLGNMMQLSGGEKALTAIALLFAIQNLKPSPFCLLDEIEAALDESNVDRFADYLKQMVKDTQFILITHRRGTMEKADRLYGITMQEKGVTALVSVDLVENDLT